MNAPWHIAIEGDGLPFLWAHGLMGSMAAEDLLGPPPLVPGVRTIRYDARGHGQTPPGDGVDAYTWPALARDMLAVADACAAPRFVAGGASMGSMTALTAALAAPERMLGLVLQIPPAIWEARQASRRRYRAAALFAAAAGPARMAEQLRKRAVDTVPTWLLTALPQVVESSMEGSAHMARGTMFDLLRGSASSNLPPREALAAVAHLPALIIAWEGDAIHPLASAQELHRLLPESELIIVNSLAELAGAGERKRAFLATLARRAG